MGKKKIVAAATEVAGTSGSAENLKILNNQLVKLVVEWRKKIEGLRLEMASLAVEHDIYDGMERDVFGLVLSSTLAENAARKNSEMAAVMKKAQSATAELKAAETRLLALTREKEALQREMERIVEEMNSRLRSLERSARIWKKKLIYSVVAAALFCVAVAVAVVIFSKGLNFKDYLRMRCGWIC